MTQSRAKTVAKGMLTVIPYFVVTFMAELLGWLGFFDAANRFIGIQHRIVNWASGTKPFDLAVETRKWLDGRK